MAANIAGDPGELRYALPFVNTSQGRFSALRYRKPQRSESPFFLRSKGADDLKKQGIAPNLAVISLSRKERRVIDFGKSLGQNLPNLTYYLPTVIDEGFSVFEKATLTELWYGVYAGVVFESKAVGPDETLVAHVVCVNLNGSPKKAFLDPYLLKTSADGKTGDARLPYSEKRKLTFELGPFRWDVRSLRVPVGQWLGPKAAKGALWLQGKKEGGKADVDWDFFEVTTTRQFAHPFKFGGEFTVVAPDSPLGKLCAETEPVAARMLEAEFKRRGSDAIVSYGEGIVKEKVIDEFKRWPKIPAIAELAQAPGIDVRTLCDRLLGNFLDKEYGPGAAFGTIRDAPARPLASA